MSHHPGCSKASDDRTAALYGTCTCAAIDQRNYTEALNRYSQTVTDRVEQLEKENAQLRAELETRRSYIPCPWL